MCQEIAKSKLKVILCQRMPRLPASRSLITSQFQSLVVSLSCFHNIWHLKG